MRVAKLIKEDWPIVRISAQNNFILLKVLSLKHWSNVDKGGIKLIHVAKCAIVIGKRYDRIKSVTTRGFVKI